MTRDAPFIYDVALSAHQLKFSIEGENLNHNVRVGNNKTRKYLRLVEMIQISDIHVGTPLLKERVVSIFWHPWVVVLPLSARIQNSFRSTATLYLIEMCPFRESEYLCIT